MDGLRELTFDEIEEVSGGDAGVPSMTTGQIQGGTTYSVSCGTGFSVYAAFNPLTTGLSTWTNLSNYGCSTGQAGNFAYSFFSQGGIGGGFSAIGY
jgi:hypothetical protein